MRKVSMVVMFLALWGFLAGCSGVSFSGVSSGEPGRPAHPQVVYTEHRSPQNAFFPTGWMGDTGDITLDTNWRDRPYAGESCVRISYRPSGSEGWAGVYWQYPENNWGEVPGYDFSRDLPQVTRLTFWARGEEGGEKVEFKVGGIKAAGKPYQDSFGPVSTGIVELTREWRQYTVDLRGQDLRMVIGGFCWVASRDKNPQGCTVYLDEIRFESEPRMTSVQLTYHDFDELQGVCTYEKFQAGECHYADYPGKAVVYGYMKKRVAIPEGARTMRVTIVVCSKGWGEGLAVDVDRWSINSGIQIIVDGEVDERTIPRSSPVHHHSYYLYESGERFSSREFNVSGRDSVVLKIRMVEGARLDFWQAILEFS
uniref:Uncharacterized protein n=1 Tax=Candidatus Caldatribacterium saccharofermentans TaxID=1454753 RepID=A0A7V4TJX6_9BACT